MATALLELVLHRCRAAVEKLNCVASPSGSGHAGHTNNINFNMRLGNICVTKNSQFNFTTK